MTTSYKVKGMGCMGCVTTISDRLSAVAGVTAVQVDLASATARIESTAEVPLQTLQKALEGTHYSLAAEGEEGESDDKAHQHKPTTPPSIKPTDPHAKVVYYCPMRCEGNKTYDHPGACPVCGMDLVSLEAPKDDNLQRKLWGAIAFTLPIFVIAMSGMWHNNPLYKLMPLSAWNWVQFVLSLPVVFYFCGFLFVRAWRSLKTLHFNMFTLIG